VNDSVTVFAASAARVILEKDATIASMRLTEDEVCAIEWLCEAAMHSNDDESEKAAATLRSLLKRLK
jgi:hypothetical protein